jgi:hypothetical protein
VISWFQFQSILPEVCLYRLCSLQAWLWMPGDVQPCRFLHPHVGSHAGLGERVPEVGEEAVWRVCGERRSAGSGTDSPVRGSHGFSLWGNTRHEVLLRIQKILVRISAEKEDTAIKYFLHSLTFYRTVFLNFNKKRWGGGEGKKR